jgi:hypothetical protein
MKKTLLFAGLLLALTASVAMAAGVGVSWKNFCWGETGSSSNLTWACNTNSNVNIRMTTSFKLDTPMPTFGAVGVYMEGMTEAAAVPDWWKLGDATTSDCRNGTILSMSTDGTVLANGGGDVCLDVWGGIGYGGVGLYSWDGNRMHMNGVWAVGAGIPIAANTEYFAVQFRVTGARTVGTCTGCLTPAIWGLQKISVEGFGGDIRPLDMPYAGGNACLTWQSSTLPCAAPVPARNTTWGQVKSLYR